MPELIRVLTVDGSSIEMRDPTVVADSIAWAIPLPDHCFDEGVEANCVPARDTTLTMPLSDVQSVAVMSSQSRTRASFGQGMLMAVGAVAVVVLAIRSFFEDWQWGPY